MREKIVIGMFVAGCIAAFVGFFAYVLSPQASVISDQQIAGSLHLAEVFIQSHLLPDGSVLYDYDSLLHEPIEGTYSAANVREVGISLSTSLLYDHDHDPEMASIEEAFAHLFLSNTEKFASNETGANAIPYIAFSIYGESVPKWAASYSDQMKTLLSNIEDRQLPSGVFVTSPTDRTGTAYYTGESLLALSYALRNAHDTVDQQQLIKEIVSAYTGVNSGAISPSEAKSIYMWLNRSTVLLLQSPLFSDAQKKIFIAAAQRMNTYTMSDILPLDDRTNNCIWGEGIAQYLQLAPPSDETSQLQKLLQSIVVESFPLQFASSTSAGTNSGGFAPQVGAVTARIDYTQHCIGMLLTYEELLKEKSP